MERKINTILNFSLRFDEVPRTLVLTGGKLVGSVLGFRVEDLQKISRLIPGNGQYTRPNDSTFKPKKDVISQPEAPQEAPGLINVPPGTLLCTDSVAKLLKKTSSRLAELSDRLQQSVRQIPHSGPGTNTNGLQDIKAGCEELVSRFHNSIFESRSDKSNEEHSKPRRLYENGRYILERCDQAEQKLNRAKNVADFKASQLLYIGESVTAMETMTESSSLEQWLVDECDFMYNAPLPFAMSSPLAHQIRGESHYDLTSAFSPSPSAALPNSAPLSSARSAASPRVLAGAYSPADGARVAAVAERARRQQRAKDVDRILKTCERQSNGGVET